MARSPVLESLSGYLIELGQRIEGLALVNEDLGPQEPKLVHQRIVAPSVGEERQTGFTPVKRQSKLALAKQLAGNIKLVFAVRLGAPGARARTQ